MKRTASLYIMLMALTLLMMLLSVTLVFAQSTPAAATTEGYNEVILKRAAKIVAALHTTDTVYNNKVTAIVADQYIQLGRIHDGRNAQIKNIKSKSTELSPDDKAVIQKLEADADLQLAQLHTAYLAKLSTLCTPEQVTAIKDGMTFNVLNVTYTAYQDMLPSLTDEQKKQILAWLTEAREHAMDAESAEKKHAWFGKYKGRINNYLSAAGIDMKKEEAAWQQRIRERKKAVKESK